MSTGTKNNVHEELKNDLFSNDVEVVLAALIRTREAGTRELVEPLLALYHSSSNTEVKATVADILSNLKVSKLEDIFIQALSKTEYRDIRKDILTFMWNSAVEPVNGLLEITDVALNGTFEESFECLTLLESMEAAIPEDLLMESIYRVKEQLGGNKGTSQQRVVWGEYLTALESRYVA